MRQFVIKDQNKDWLFDLDGNSYHPKLRDEIEKGMVVGLRITERDIPTNERIKFVDGFKDYIQLYNNFWKLREKEEQCIEAIRDEIKKVVLELGENVDKLEEEKRIIELKIIKLKEKIKINTSQEYIDEVKSNHKKIGGIDKAIDKIVKQKNNLEQNVIHFPLKRKKLIS